MTNGEKALSEALTESVRMASMISFALEHKRLSAGSAGAHSQAIAADVASKKLREQFASLRAAMEHAFAENNMGSLS